MVFAVVEGHLDGRLLKVLWRQLGLDEHPLQVRDAGGSGFWLLASKYNEAGRHQRVIGLADLEQAPCASALMQQLKPSRSPGFKLRLAVRMLESWLLADRDAVAAFLGVRAAAIPREPDREAHPKRALVDLARTSRKRSIREALVPNGSGALVGPEYTAVIGSFIDVRWDAARARTNSPSLDRACMRWTEA